MNLLSQFAIGLLFFIIYLGTPAALVWGWVGWIQHSKSWTITPILSLVGFVLATASAFLALYAIADAPTHHFTLMRFLSWGLRLSLAGFLFAICGIWKKGSLRYYAPLCAIGTFAFWTLAGVMD